MTLEMCTFTRVEIEFPALRDGVPDMESAVAAVQNLQAAIGRLKGIESVLAAVTAGDVDAVEAAKRAAIDKSNEATRQIDGPYAFTEVHRATYGAWAMALSAAAALATAAQRLEAPEPRADAVYYADLARAHYARADRLRALALPA